MSTRPKCSEASLAALSRSNRIKAGSGRGRPQADGAERPAKRSFRDVVSQASRRSATVKNSYGMRRGTRSISAGSSQLARRLPGPALACMRECAHLMKPKQPRNLGYMQLRVVEVTNCQIAPQLLKYFSEVEPFVGKLSCKRPLAHSQTASNVFHEHSSMRKRRRDRVLNSRAQLAHNSFSMG
jgi:hypothetical protein